MIGESNAKRQDELVRSTMRVRDDDVVGPDHDPGAARLLAAIISEDSRHYRRAPLPHRRRRYALAIGLACAAIALAIGLASLVQSGPPVQHFTAGKIVQLVSDRGVPVTGRIPATADANGTVDWSKIPEYVSVWTSTEGTIVGYVRKSDLEDPASPSSLTTGVPACGLYGVPVYNATLQVIGHEYPGAGFVRLGAVPNCSGQAATTTTISPQ